MAGGDGFREQAYRDAIRMVAEAEQAKRSQSAAEQDDSEDWPLLTFLFGGLALALVVNTFVGLMPV